MGVSRCGVRLIGTQEREGMVRDETHRSTMMIDNQATRLPVEYDGLDIVLNIKHVILLFNNYMIDYHTKDSTPPHRYTMR